MDKKSSVLNDLLRCLKRDYLFVLGEDYYLSIRRFRDGDWTILVFPTERHPFFTNRAMLSFLSFAEAFHLECFFESRNNVPVIMMFPV